MQTTDSFRTFAFDLLWPDMSRSFLSFQFLLWSRPYTYIHLRYWYNPAILGFETLAEEEGEKQNRQDETN